MWVLVMGHHTNADKIAIYGYETRELMIKQARNLIPQQYELCDDGDEIVDQNESTDDEPDFWWNMTLKSGLLITIDGRKMK